MNAVSVIPTQFLNCSLQEQAELLYTNAKQIFEQVKRKSNLKEQSSLFFKAFSDTNTCKNNLIQIESLLKSKKYSESIQISKQTIELSLSGFHYFQTYDWLFLMSIISTGFLGWMAFVSLFIYTTYYKKTSKHQQSSLTSSSSLSLSLLSSNTTIQNLNSQPLSQHHQTCTITNINQNSTTNQQIKSNSNPNPNNNLSIYFSWIIFGILFSILVFKLFFENSPLIYYGYCIFPVFFWSQVLSQWKDLKDLLYEISYFPIYTFGFIFLIISLLEILVLSFFYRGILCFCVILIGLFSWKHFGFLYFFIYLIMSLFPLLPVDFGDQLYFVYLGGFLLIPFVFIPFLLEKLNSSPPISSFHKILSFIQILLISISIYQVYRSDSSIFFYIITWSVCCKL